MKPNADLFNPDPGYLRGLIAKTGMPQRAVARRIGVSERMFRQYITDPANSSYVRCPYSVQFALECLAA